MVIIKTWVKHQVKFKPKHSLSFFYEKYQVSEIKTRKFPVGTLRFRNDVCVVYETEL